MPQTIVPALTEVLTFMVSLLLKRGDYWFCGSGSDLLVAPDDESSRVFHNPSCCRRPALILEGVFPGLIP